MVKSRYWIFYVAFSAVIVVIAAVHFILKSGSDIRMPMTLFMDRAGDSSDESSIVSVTGDDVMFSMKNRRYNAVTKDTRIARRMTIRTGADSSVSFILKSSGYYYIYPNSVVYVADVGRFTAGGTGRDYGRFSEFAVESGEFFCGVNTYSDNSLVRVRTSTADLMVSKGRFFVKCDNDFVTAVTCVDGEVRYRPAVQRYDTGRKYSENDDKPIQRFLSHRNRLSSGEFVTLTHEMSSDFENLIDKVCNSSFFPNIDRQDMTNTLTIEPSKLEQSELPKMPYRFNQNE
ncbi:MAG: FecR domain-containing protein [Spirochaetales bacterium]|nr:FecR domain-containing protein [Spirochaetales bacterium]